MNYSIEFLRLVAVILITFTHTRHDFTDGGFYFIIEELPKYGTLILSIISGYLFWKTTRKDKNILNKKIKSLLIPFLIANGVVLILVLIFNFFGFNFLNRLGYDLNIIKEGLFSLNEPPINPPTYFIRDLFVIFCFIALLYNRNIKVLLIIIPLLFWGRLFIRIDILFLFLIGLIYALGENRIPKKTGLIVSFLILLISYFYYDFFFPYIIAIFIFSFFMDLKMNFVKVGSYSYLLHLYHCPIMIALYPVINKLIENVYLKVIAQIIISIILVFGFFKIIKKYPKLNIVSGGR